LTNSSPGYRPSPIAPQQDSSRFVVPIFIVIGLLLAVSVFVGVVSLFHSTGKMAGEASKPSDKFLGDLQSHNYSAAWSQMTPDAQAVTTVSSIQTFQEMLEKTDGAIVSWGKPAWFVQYNNGVGYVRLTYPLTCAQRKATITLVEQRDSSGAYAVRGFNYQF